MTLGVEPDMAPEVETVDYVIEILLDLRLLGEVLMPLPFFEELLREEVGVGVALRIEDGLRDNGSSTTYPRRRFLLRAP